MSQYTATNPVRDLESGGAALALVPLVGRILISAIFLLSGLSKITAPTAMIGYISSAGLPLPQVGLAIAIVVEVAGSIALIAGFHTRLTAAILAVFSVATRWRSTTTSATRASSSTSSRISRWPAGFCRSFAFGAGPFSLDARPPLATHSEPRETGRPDDDDPRTGTG